MTSSPRCSPNDLPTRWGHGRLAGRIILITGAARGMGRSHALRLAEEVADLILVDICAPTAGLDYSMSTPGDLADTAKEVEALDRRLFTSRPTAAIRITCSPW
jgi:NAD(P)-dependent dehydrogenase (short-subunit alcohol dehydrogenase family)